MKEVDVVVVGGGISGLYLSQLLDKKGINFLTVDNKKTIGNKGFRAVSEECFKKINPDSDIILDFLDQVDIISAHGYKISTDIKGYSMKTSDIEKDFMEKISDRKRILTGVSVEKIVDLEKNKISLGNETVTFKIMVLACGADRGSSRNQLGIKNSLIADVHACEIKTMGERETGVVVDNENAKGLFTWMMPIGEKRMEVGIFSVEKNRDWKKRLFSVNTIKSFKNHEIVEEFHGQTPLSTANRCFGKNWLAIGSAGNGQPVVGVPVFQSVEDAEVASEVIEKHLDGVSNLDLYQKIWVKRHKKRLVFLNLIQKTLINIDSRGVDVLMRATGLFFPVRWM